MRVLALFCVLMIGSSSVSAQDYTQLDTRIPRFSYGMYSINGEVGSVSYNRVGRFTYGYFSDGSRSTTTKVGNRLYTDIWIEPKQSSVSKKLRP